MTRPLVDPTPRDTFQQDDRIALEGPACHVESDGEQFASDDVDDVAGVEIPALPSAFNQSRGFCIQRSLHHDLRLGRVSVFPGQWRKERKQRPRPSGSVCGNAAE